MCDTKSDAVRSLASLWMLAVVFRDGQGVHTLDTYLCLGISGRWDGEGNAKCIGALHRVRPRLILETIG